ncbi:MAG: phage holin family protein [Myxococcaceae bacterium]
MALGTQVRELVDAFSELVAQHVRLARMELQEDARFVGLRVGLIAAFAPLILVGYGFLCVALALLLKRVMAIDLAFLLVGVLNLLIGGIGIAVVARQLGQRKVMQATMSELDSSTALLLPKETERA